MLIRVPEVFLIDENNQPKGVMKTSEALKLAAVAELDLVEISPNAKPPVVKILDFGKYQYDKDKQAQQARKHHKDVVVKEVRLSPNIGDGDLNVKIRQAEKFLKDGSKVKATVMFRGRQIVYSDLGIKLLERFVDRLREIAKMEQAPVKQGRSIQIVIAPR